HAAALDRLWQSLRDDLREHIVVRKDAAWLRHRYLENPDKQYRLFLLYRRFTGRPLGLVVLKVEDDKVLLMDCVGSLAALPALLRLARRETALLHRSRLYTWCSAAFGQYFSATGATLRELGVVIP